MGSLRRRILAGSGANAFGQAITVGIQLFSLPLFLLHWDPATYGSWLILSAIPSYLSMADVGMVSAAGNKMTIAVGQQDHAYANRIFQSALLFMLLVCGSVLLVVVPACLWLPVPWLPIASDQRLALAALSGGVVLAFFNGLAEAVFKAHGRYPLGTLLGHLVRLGEWGGSMLGLWLLGSFTAVAVGGLMARGLGVGLITFSAARYGGGLRWGLRDAQFAEVRRMLKPAASFMLFPTTFALSFQGVTLLVGHMLGPAAVAVFNTYRTLVRVAVQFTSVFSFALWPEFSRLYGLGGLAVILPLYRRAFRIGALLAIGTSVAIYVVAQPLLGFWTRGAIPFVPPLMLVMLVYAAISGCAHVPRTLLMATNNHLEFGLSMLGICLAQLAVVQLIGRHLGLIGAGFALLLSEAIALCVCAIFVRRIFKKSPSEKHATPSNVSPLCLGIETASCRSE